MMNSLRVWVTRRLWRQVNQHAESRRWPSHTWESIMKRIGTSLSAHIRQQRPSHAQHIAQYQDITRHLSSIIVRGVDNSSLITYALRNAQVRSTYRLPYSYCTNYSYHDDDSREWKRRRLSGCWVISLHRFIYSLILCDTEFVLWEIARFYINLHYVMSLLTVFYPILGTFLIGVGAKNCSLLQHVGRNLDRNWCKKLQFFASVLGAILTEGGAEIFGPNSQNEISELGVVWCLLTLRGISDSHLQAH